MPHKLLHSVIGWQQCQEKLFIMNFISKSPDDLKQLFFSFMKREMCPTSPTSHLNPGDSDLISGTLTDYDYESGHCTVIIVVHTVVPLHLYLTSDVFWRNVQCWSHLKDANWSIFITGCGGGEKKLHVDVRHLHITVMMINATSLTFCTCPFLVCHNDCTSGNDTSLILGNSL